MSIISWDGPPSWDDQKHEQCPNQELVGRRIVGMIGMNAATGDNSRIPMYPH